MLTLYINPSSYFRIVRSAIIIPAHANVHIDSTLLHKIACGLGINAHRRCFDLSYQIGDANPLLTSASHEKDSRLLFVGGTAIEAATFTQVMSERYQLVGRLQAVSGFADDLLASVDATIDEYRPTHLIFGLGAPVQEKLAIHYEQKFPTLDVRTCGGFITQTSLNGGDFYPQWIQKLGMRWLYRFYKQPAVIRRTLVEYPRGILYYVQSKLSSKLA